MLTFYIICYVSKLVLSLTHVVAHRGTHTNSKMHTHTHTLATHITEGRERRGEEKREVMAVGGEWKSRGCAQVSQDQNMSAMLVSQL